MLVGSLLLTAVVSNNCWAQQTPAQKWGAASEQYYPWVQSRDSIVRGINTVTFAPNSTGDVLEVQFELPTPQYIHIRVYSITGLAVVNTTAKVADRMPHTERVLMGNLSTGFYILVIETATERIVRKLFRP